MSDKLGSSPIFPHKVEEKQGQLRELLGEETLLQFREDINEIFVRNTDYEGATPKQKRKWMIQGRRGLDETRSRYLSFDTTLDILSLSDWGLSILVAVAVNECLKAVGVAPLHSILFSIVLSILLYGMNTGLVFTKALVTEIAYSKKGFSERLPPGELRFRAGWNKGVIQSSTSLVGLMVYGMVTSPGSRSYELGLDFVDWWTRWKNEKD